MRTAWPSGTQLSTQQIIYNRLADFWGELRCCRKKTSDSFLHFLLDYMKQNYFRKHPKMLCQEIMTWLLQIIHTPCCDFYMADIWYNTTILLSHPLYSAAGFVALALYALLTWLLPVAQWQKTKYTSIQVFSTTLLLHGVMGGGFDTTVHCSAKCGWDYLYSQCMWLNSCGSTVILLYKSDNVMMTPLIHKGGFEQHIFCTTVC